MIIKNTTNFFSMRGGCGAYVFDKGGRFICGYHKLANLPPTFTIYDSKFNKKAELTAGPSIEKFERESFTFVNKESFSVYFIYPDRALIILSDLKKGNFLLALLSFNYEQKVYEILDNRIFNTYFHSALVGYGDDYGLFSMKICTDERGKRLTYVFRGFKLESDKIVKEMEKELNIDCYDDNEPKCPHLRKQKLWFVKRSDKAPNNPPEPTPGTSSDIPMDISPEPVPSTSSYVPPPRTSSSIHMDISPEPVPSTSSYVPPPSTSSKIHMDISPEPVPSTSSYVPPPSTSSSIHMDISPEPVPSTSSYVPPPSTSSKIPRPRTLNNRRRRNRSRFPRKDEEFVSKNNSEYYYIGYFDLLEERPSEHWVSYLCQKNENLVHFQWTSDAMLVQISTNEFHLLDLDSLERVNLKSSEHFLCANSGERQQWVAFTLLDEYYILSKFVYFCDDNIVLTAINNVETINQISLKSTPNLLDIAWTSALNYDQLVKLSKAKLPYKSVM